jgi:hypothetical protein
MNMNFTNRTLMAGGLLAAALTANAAPLHRADVPANPTWVIHMDVDALRPTSVGQFLLSEMDKPENQAKLSVFQSLAGFDLRSQLHGVTLYGTGSNPQDAVLIAYADFDPAKLTNLAKAAKEPENTAYKSHTIYSWLDEKKAKHGEHPRVYAAIQGARVLFGQRETSVAKALDVLDGAVPQLAASSAFPQLGAAGDTSFIEAAGAKMDFAAADPNAAMFRLSKQARLQINEAQGAINATLTLEANDEAIAQQMLTVGQGLVGLMKLQQDKPEAVKLANALAVKQDGQQVVATLSLPSGDVVQLMRAGAAREAAKKEAKKKAAEAEAK